MPIDLTVWDSDLDGMIADLSSTLVWDSPTGTQTLSCTISPISRSDDVQNEGIYANRTFECCAPLAAFTNSVAPTPRTNLQIDRVKYFVESTENDPVGFKAQLRRL